MLLGISCTTVYQEQDSQLQRPLQLSASHRNHWIIPFVGRQIVKLLTIKQLSAVRCMVNWDVGLNR